ncbi:hypothetical protein [Pimelobacter simplex]|nr:hypothetical protein [Pimelobacter simplex]
MLDALPATASGLLSPEARHAAAAHLAADGVVPVLTDDGFVAAGSAG